jgi:aminotransferase
MKNFNRINPDVANIPQSKREAILAATQRKKNLANLASGNPDMPMPKTIVDRLTAYLSSGLVRYTDYYGFPELRQRLAQVLQSQWQITTDPNTELIVTCGVQEGLYVVMRAILQPGDEVLIPSPHYGTYFQNTVACGAKPVLVPLDEADGFIPDVDRLVRAVTPQSRAIVFCNPSNPLGVVWPRDTLEALADLARKHNLLVLVDEIYRDYIYTTPPPSIAALPGMKTQTFTFGGFSKSYLMMGLRIGFVAGPAHLMSAVKKLHYCVAMCPSVVGQVAAMAAIDCPAEELKPIVAEFREKLKILYEGVAALPRVSCVPPGGSFYIFPNFKSYSSNSMTLALKLIEEADVSTLPGTEFGELGEGYLRLSVCARRPEVEEGLKRLQSFIHRYARDGKKI